MEVAKTLNEKISRYLQVTLELCAYAGTGNVLLVIIICCLSWLLENLEHYCYALSIWQVQKFLAFCGEHTEKAESYQSAAVLGIALVSMAEELGLDMAVRSLEHLLQYGEQHIRRTVPLALAILSVSNPKVLLQLTWTMHLWFLYRDFNRFPFSDKYHGYVE